jgi:hypothetical protein
MFLVPIMIVVDIIMHQMSPTTMPLPLFTPHALIDPSALRAAKANAVE